MALILDYDIVILSSFPSNIYGIQRDTVRFHEVSLYYLGLRDSNDHRS